MARQGVVLAAMLAAALGATGAAAQTLEQLQNRYELERSQQRMERQSLERRLESDLRNQQLQNRVERQSLERRLDARRVQPFPPAGTLRR